MERGWPRSQSLFPFLTFFYLCESRPATRFAREGPPQKQIRIMRRILSCTALAVLLTFTTFAQNVLSGRKATSPIITEDSVTFRLAADYATSVKLSGSWQKAPVDMRRGEDFIWTVTIQKLTPDIYTYCFIVDGVEAPDPSNPSSLSLPEGIRSIFLKPGSKSDNFRDISAGGSISAVWYDSPSLGMKRRMWVYTPADYGQNRRMKYPVLYLLHPEGGNEDSWLTLGRAAQILDNLIAKGKAQPMLVVMPNCDARLASGLSLTGSPAPLSDRNAGPGLFETSLVRDIIPYVESHYNVHKGKSYRAVSGAGTGGEHALRLSCQYPDLFAYVCPLSVGFRGMNRSGSPVFFDEERTLAYFDRLAKSRLSLVWTACGSEDPVYDDAQRLDRELTQHNVWHSFFVTGGGHDWNNWRHYLDMFLPILFK